MITWLRNYAPLFLFAAAFSVLSTGCGPQARVYNPSFHALVEENAYYTQWEHETHRTHVDFDKRSAKDKKAYWNWRQSQNDH
jgi:hypothetical protein